MIIRSKLRRAFSIVEVLMALAILVFAAFGIYEQFLKSHQQGQDQLKRIQARALAQQELEQLRAAPYDVVKTFKHAGPFYPDHPQFIYQDQIEPTSSSLLRITVRVGWDMPANQKTFEPERSVTVKGIKAP